MSAMHRAKSQVLYRFTPKSAFRYNETNGWCEVTSIELQRPGGLTPALAQALRQMLVSWDAIGPDGFPDPLLAPHKYEVGEPYQVHYTLHPLVFACRNCGRIQYYQDLDRLIKLNYQLSCRQCKHVGTLVQVPYTFIHECGRADTIFVPKHEPNHTIRMINRGRFQESYWYCDTCKRPLTQPGKQGLGFRRCSCGKSMRGTTLQDPEVHFTHTLSLVNTDDKVLECAGENANLGESLLAGFLHLPAYRREEIEDLLAAVPSDDAAQKQADEMRTILAATITDPAQLEATVQHLVAQVVSPQTAKQQALRDELQRLLGAQSPLVPKAKTSRQLLEYLYVRDHPRMQATNLPTALQRAREHGDSLAENRHEADRRTADDLGIANLQLIEGFPLLLAAVGYSRFKGSPSEGTKLRPFIAERPKIPLYTVSSTTEALLFELDPWREAAWLLENNLATAPSAPFADEQGVRLWLLEQRQHFLGRPDDQQGQVAQSDRAAHLTLLPWEKERGVLPADRVAATSFGLLHSLSHMLINAATAQVGFEPDSLAEYLFPVAGAGVIYASGHQEFTLGGIVSAFHLNLTYWLTSAYDLAQRCMYDPLCNVRGGACHACSYLRFSCPHFNRTISRAFLTGGPVEGLDQPVVGYWSPQLRDRAKSLQGAVSS